MKKTKDKKREKQKKVKPYGIPDMKPLTTGPDPLQYNDKIIDETQTSVIE